MNPRIIRKNRPDRVFRKTTYRDAWDYLAMDFAERCAYSMQHTYRVGGKKCMEVDHFNPRRKNDYIQEYDNLFPASRHCNGAKKDRWPTNKDRAKGARFLNCCKEVDYGVHIFEDPDTHEVVGVTPEGRYHVRNCDLNAEHLVAERRERADLWRLLESTPIHVRKDGVRLAEIEMLKKIAETMIPKIEYLSGDALERQRARRKTLSEIQINTSNYGLE